jgi:hypothetical protein
LFSENNSKFGKEQMSGAGKFGYLLLSVSAKGA